MRVIGGLRMNKNDECFIQGSVKFTMNVDSSVIILIETIKGVIATAKKKHFKYTLYQKSAWSLIVTGLNNVLFN